MKILVTGASGFLGLNLLKHLSRARPEATIIAADLCAPTRDDIAGLDQVVRSSVFKLLDVRDPEACLELVTSMGATHIVHAAGVTLSEQTATAVDLSYRVNVQGADNLLKAAVAAETVERFLLLSSSGVYCQTGQNLSCSEEDELQLDSSYASSKREAELLMRRYEAAESFVGAVARIGPVYGPFERSRKTRPRVSLIQRLLDLLMDGRPVRIGGTDHCRDWTHAGDIAAALEAMLFCPGLNHCLYNVGAGRSVSAREIIAIFIEQGLEVHWDESIADLMLDPRDGRKTAAIERLQRDTGFMPRFDIHAGLAAVIADEFARRAHSEIVHP